MLLPSLESVWWLLPEIWTKIIENLQYSDARSVFLVNRSARDSAAQLKTVTFRSNRELNSSTARRFPNLRNVNIWCLVDLQDAHENVSQNYSLSADAVHRTVPFLVALQQHSPKLRKASIGGYVLHCGFVFFRDFFDLHMMFLLHRVERKVDLDL